MGNIPYDRGKGHILELLIRENLAPFVITFDIHEGKGEKGESIEIYFQVRFGGVNHLKIPLSALSGLEELSKGINSFLQWKWKEEQKKQTPSEQTVITWKPKQEEE